MQLASVNFKMASSGGKRPDEVKADTYAKSGAAPTLYYVRTACSIQCGHGESKMWQSKENRRHT